MSTPESAGVAIVTGASRGIGREIARTLAAAGYAVAALARSEDDLRETVRLTERAGTGAVPFVVDVTDHEQVKRVVADIDGRMGAVELLVNNAGVMGPTGPIWDDDFDPDEWWRCLDVNVRGPFLFSRAVLPGMVRRRRGRIVNISSGAALAARPWMAAYGLSKTALTRFSEALAEEVAEHGIRVFSVAPGMVRTEMPLGLVESGVDEKWLGGKFATRFDEGSDVPPERSAQLVLELASGSADALSGLHLDVTDDLGELVERADEIEAKGLYRLGLARLA